MESISSHKYKQYQRQQRKVVNEPDFLGGMNFSDNPLMPGTHKLLVNYIQKDFGSRIRPRGGWRLITPPTALGIGLGELYIHHTGTTFVEDETGNVFLRRYALVLSLPTAGSTHGSMLNSRVLIEEALDPTDPNFNKVPGELKVSTPKVGSSPLSIKHDTNQHMTQMHGMTVTNPSPSEMFATINGNTYLLTSVGLGRLHVYYDTATETYTHEVKLVTPEAVTPMQAVNYGYNMLLASPYQFNNTSGVNFSPYGILPYDVDTGVIKMQAKVGEKIKFKLVYQYVPAAEYKVQWEVQDIYKQDGVTVIQKKEDSPTYTNGAEISLEYMSPFKQFSVIATVYLASDLANPIRVVLLASYHLSDDANTTKVETKEYDLHNATGFTTWKNQLVFYGVPGAEMGIFLSDVNNPTYVPFPNNSLLFNEKVIKAFPYMNSLMVVTEHTMFQVDFALESGYTYKPVQANMQLRDDDAASMYGVRNMVCFKSRNYYYMIVPNIKNDKGELQIAPISNSITYMLDYFEDNIKSILGEVYTFRALFAVPAESLIITLHDYKSYTEGTRLRHVYKLKIEPAELTPVYADVHLVYDTVFRAWTMEVMESTRRPLTVFQSIATGYAQFLNLYTDSNDETYVQWIGVDENNPEDLFMLDGLKARLLPNYQLIDTGKRDLQGTMKKRMRQVILEFNNLSDVDVEFNHLAYVDDEPRGDLFIYTVQHITDPEDPEYGKVYVVREYAEPTVVYGVTMLDFWSLQNSQFPEQSVIKAHVDISGKGYYPRLKLVTRTSNLFELNNISWVYRDMNAR
jgi:hypothetical protein